MDDAGARRPTSFDPGDLSFDAGETVGFTFAGESQFHTFTVTDLGIDVDVAGGRDCQLPVHIRFQSPVERRFIFTVGLGRQRYLPPGCAPRPALSLKPRLPREIARNVTKRKLAQAVPVVGAAVGEVSLRVPKVHDPPIHLDEGVWPRPR